MLQSVPALIACVVMLHAPARQSVGCLQTSLQVMGLCQPCVGNLATHGRRGCLTHAAMRTGGWAWAKGHKERAERGRVLGGHD